MSREQAVAISESQRAFASGEKAAMEKVIAEHDALQKSVEPVKRDLNNIPEELQEAFQIIRSESASSATRGVTVPKMTAEEKTVGFSSSSPQWMVDLQKRMKSIDEPLFSRKEIENLIKKQEAGKKLTFKQSLRWQHLEDVASKLKTEDPGMVAGDLLETFEQKGFTGLGGKDIVAGNLKIGDTILAEVNGRMGEHLVKGESPEGNVILKSPEGLETIIDVFDEIKVEAIRKKGVKAEPTKAFLDQAKKIQHEKNLKAIRDKHFKEEAKKAKAPKLTEAEKATLVKELLNFKVIPKTQRLNLSQGLMNAKTKKGTQSVVNKIFEALDVGIRRQEVKGVMKEKKFGGT
jgi:hypothetical protein